MKPTLVITKCAGCIFLQLLLWRQSFWLHNNSSDRTQTMKRPNQEFLPKPNRTGLIPDRNFGRLLTHTRKRPNQEFLPNPNRTSDFFAEPNRTGQNQSNPEPNRNFGRFLTQTKPALLANPGTHIHSMCVYCVPPTGVCQKSRFRLRPKMGKFWPVYYRRLYVIQSAVIYRPKFPNFRLVQLTFD